MLPTYRNQLAQLLASIDQLIAKNEATTLADGDLAKLTEIAESLCGLYEMRDGLEAKLAKV
jgi:hypothetical protein